MLISKQSNEKLQQVKERVNMKRNPHIRQMMKLECQKAFQSKGFWIALLIGMLVAGSHVWKHFVEGCYLIGEDVVPLGIYYTGSAFGQRMGMDVEIEGSLFVFLMPLLASLPYATSYSKERREGYLKQAASRGGVKDYLWAKYAAVFISGAVVVMLPLLFDFMMVTLDTPMRDPVTMISSMGRVERWVTKLYYYHPLLHAFFYIGATGFIAGCFASLALVTAGLGVSPFTVWATPMLTALIMNYVLAPLNLLEWNPGIYLIPNVQFFPLGRAVIECIISALLVFLFFIRKVSRDELYE